MIQQILAEQKVVHLSPARSIQDHLPLIPAPLRKQTFTLQPPRRYLPLSKDQFQYASPAKRLNLFKRILLPALFLCLPQSLCILSLSDDDNFSGRSVSVPGARHSCAGTSRVHSQLLLCRFDILVKRLHVIIDLLLPGLKLTLCLPDLLRITVDRLQFAERIGPGSLSHILNSLLVVIVASAICKKGVPVNLLPRGRYLPGIHQKSRQLAAHIRRHIFIFLYVPVQL